MSKSNTPVETYCILTQEGNLPFNVVRTEEEAKEIISTILESRSPDYIKVVSADYHESKVLELGTVITKLVQCLDMAKGQLQHAGYTKNVVPNIEKVLAKYDVYNVNRTLPG